MKVLACDCCGSQRKVSRFRLTGSGINKEPDESSHRSADLCESCAVSLLHCWEENRKRGA